MRQVMVLVVAAILALPAPICAAYELGPVIGYESAWQLAWEEPEQPAAQPEADDPEAWGSEEEAVPAEAQPAGDEGSSEDEGYYDDYDYEVEEPPGSAPQEEF